MSGGRAPALAEFLVTLRRAAVSVYLAAEEGPAAHLSALLNQAADELEADAAALTAVLARLTALEAAHRDLVAALPTVLQLRSVQYVNQFCRGCLTVQPASCAPDCWIARLLARTP